MKLQSDPFFLFYIWCYNLRVDFEDEYMSKRILFFVSILIFFGVIIFALWETGQLSSINREDTNGEESSLLSVPEYLQDGGYENFPTISSQEVIPSLPQELDFLILSNTENLEIRSIQYSNGQNGYKVYFEVERTIADVMRDYYKSIAMAEWEIVYAGRSGLGVIDTENISYRGRILIESSQEISSNLSIVDINLIIK